MDRINFTQQCDDTVERRPYYNSHRDIHPQEVIYAQPVTIKPVGRPLPAIPVKRPGSFLGPKPPGFAPGPVYGGPPPHYNGPSPFNPPPPSFSGPYPGFKKPGIKPIYEPAFEGGGGVDYDDKYIKKQGIVPLNQGSGVQQHVHHHYHHGEGNGAGVAPIIGAGPIGNNGFNNYGNGGGFNDYEEYKKNFKVKGPSSNNNHGVIGSASTNSNYANRFPAYEKPNEFGGLNKGKQLGGPGFNNGFNGLGNNNNNNFGSHNNYNRPTSEFGLDGFDNGLSNDDCVCVPYDQCSTLDQAGRKDDLFLAIDPRNLPKSIEADTEEVVVTDGNGTMNIVRVPKSANETETAESKSDEGKKEESPVSSDESGSEEKRSKRDVETASKKEDKTDEQAQSVSHAVKSYT